MFRTWWMTWTTWLVSPVDVNSKLYISGAWRRALVIPEGECALRFWASDNRTLVSDWQEKEANNLWAYRLSICGNVFLPRPEGSWSQIYMRVWHVFMNQFTTVLTPSTLFSVVCLLGTWYLKYKIRSPEAGIEILFWECAIRRRIAK